MAGNELDGGMIADDGLVIDEPFSGEDYAGLQLRSVTERPAFSESPSSISGWMTLFLFIPLRNQTGPEDTRYLQLQEEAKKLVGKEDLEIIKALQKFMKNDRGHPAYKLLVQCEKRLDPQATQEQIVAVTAEAADAILAGDRPTLEEIV